MSDFIRLPPNGPPPPPPPPPRGGRGNFGGYHGGGRGGGRFSGGGGRWNNHRGCGRYQQQHGRGGWRGSGRGGRGRGRGGGRSGQMDNSNVKADAAMIQEIGLPPPPPPPSSSATDAAPTMTTTKRKRNLRIAIQGCAHGSLDRIYATLQARDGPPIDLLLCCGDFQAIRNAADLETLAVPQKYREIGTFWRYYSGQLRAPIPTIFIGGNHEASGYLQELFYGGWVAPNIYYLGAAGVVRFCGLRIGGLSGIYKSHDYSKGRYEAPPYDKGSLRSVYHVRNVEVYRMKCLGGAAAGSSTSRPSRRLDIMLSHDWPRGIEQHGDTAGLLRKKSFFRQEIQENNLGSPANEDVLNNIKPRWWFSAHLHVKFEATVRHNVEEEQKPSSSSSPSMGGLIPSQVATSTAAKEEAMDNAASENSSKNEQTTSFVGLESSACPVESTTPDLTEQMTRFLSLDKCLPRRQHLQIVNIPMPDEGNVANNDETGDDGVVDDDTNRPFQLEYDVEWLAILRKTHNLTQFTHSYVPVPNETVAVTDEEMEAVRSMIAEWRQQRKSSQELRNEKDDASDDNTSRPSAAAENELAIPKNFCITAPPHGSPGSEFASNGSALVGNPQTDELLDMLGLNHIVTVPYKRNDNESLMHGQRQQQLSPIVQLTPDDNEIDLDGDDDGAGSVDDNRPSELSPDNNEIDLDEDDEDDVPVNGKPPVVEEQADDNAIDLDDEEDVHGEKSKGDVQVQTKKARTGSIEK